MSRYLLDTGIASDLINRRLGVEQKAREAVQRGDKLGIGTPVFGELVGGIEHSDAPARQRKKLKHGLRAITIWPFDEAAAWEYGRIYAKLRRIGRPITDRHAYRGHCPESRRLHRRYEGLGPISRTRLVSRRLVEVLVGNALAFAVRSLVRCPACLWRQQ